MKSIAALATTAALSLASSASAAVLVVDPAGGPFTSIAAAVNAAQDGDVVLVKTGNYAPFDVVSKGIAVVVDVGAEATVFGTVKVNGLAAGQTAVLHRLVIEPVTHASPGESIGLILENNLGRVRVQACTIRGADGFGLAPQSCVEAGPPEGRDAVQIVDCADVALQLCDVAGGAGGNLFEFPGCDGFPLESGVGGDAVDASGTMTLTIHDSVLQGGLGGSAWYQGSNGGAGLRLRNTTLFSSNVAASGGKGGFASDCIVPPFGGNGGHGLELDQPSLARLLSTTLTGGAAGSGAPCGVNGAAGAETFGAGTIKVLVGSSKGLGGLKVLREGQADSVHFLGLPGETAFLLLSPSAEGAFAPGLRGVLLVGSPLIGPILFGGVPAGGLLSVPYTIPTLPAGLQGLVVHLQGALVPATGLPTLTGVSILTLLDTSF